MAKGKSVREKGKIKFSSYFKEIGDGSLVSVVEDRGVRADFPKRMQGRSGKIVGSRGSFKIVELNMGGKKTTLVVHPTHLRKIK